MKIKSQFKKYCLEVAEIVIKKFYRKEFKNSNQDKLNQDATIIKVVILKAQEAINKTENFSAINISEDTMIYAVGKKSIFFALAFEYFEKSIKPSNLTYERIYDDWLEEKKKKESLTGLDKYFNTRDPHFNHNAYYWRIELKTKNLFEDIVIPFIILSEYLEFKFKYNQPIATIDKIDKLMDENHLNKEQRLFIYDKLNGLIANADIETQNRLSILNIEITDRRWNLEPYDFEEENKKFNIDNILEESKQNNSLEDQLSFLRRKQLDLKSEADETGFIQDLINSIQIEIDSLYLKINRTKNDKEDFIKGELEDIKENQKSIISSLDIIQSELDKFLIKHKTEIESLQKLIETDFKKLFDSEYEKKTILEKLNKMADENKNPDWYNQPLKSKLKFMLPLVIFKYEKEMDISNFKFPKNMGELKQIFVND